MRAGALLIHHLRHVAMASQSQYTGPKPTTAFGAARGQNTAFPAAVAMKRRGRGGGIGGSYLGAEAAALLACFTATLLVLPLLLPPLPPPPSMFLFVPVGIFAVLLLLVFVPFDARGAVTVGPPSSCSSPSPPTVLLVVVLA